MIHESQCRRNYVIVLAMLLTASFVSGEQKRPITVKDCVKTRRIPPGVLGEVPPVQLSPHGFHVAYIVKAPNVETNHNDFQLYIRDLRRLEAHDNGRLLLQADKLSEVEWVGSDRLMIRVGRRSDKGIEREVDIVDTRTSGSRKLVFPVPVEDVSLSSDGRIVAFSSLVTPEASTVVKQEALEQRGYPIIFGSGPGGPRQWPPEYEIYLGTIDDGGTVQARKLHFEGPADAPRRSCLRWVQNLRLSPDGKYLLFKYSADSVPKLWLDHPLVKELTGFGTRAESHLLVLYDIATEHLRVAFNYPGALLTASWAGDSRAYSVISPAPFGTTEEKEETEQALSFGRLFYYLYRFEHVFAVDAQSGAVTKVIHRDSGEPGNLKFIFDAPLAWTTSRQMLVRTAENNIAEMELIAGNWKKVDEFQLPHDKAFKSIFASNGQVLVGISQDTTTPPDLFVLDIKTGKSTVLTDLNPEYRSIALGEVEKIEWSNRYGSKCVGKLIKPVGYESGKRYPLVLMANYTDDNHFISDSLYTTAFAPQSLANAGFVVLMSQYPREDKFPRGEFPGDMGQAYNWVSMMETAIDSLAGKGIIDRTKVGIVGFSRTSWLVDFLLTHSRYKLMAASSADSGLYTYGGYFRYNRPLQLLAGDETQVGGPPFGDTRKYWLEYAPPFNAEKITTPLLMEYTDTAEHGLEFFVALSRLGKAVEFFRYPKGAHPLDTPFERIASLQRNLDWFRFWMQDYEDEAPSYDPGQYVRWRKLRDQQQWNERMRGQARDPVVEFLRQTSPGATTPPQNRAPALMTQP